MDEPTNRSQTTQPQKNRQPATTLATCRRLFWDCTALPHPQFCPCERIANECGLGGVVCNSIQLGDLPPFNQTAVRLHVRLDLKNEDTAIRRYACKKMRHADAVLIEAPNYLIQSGKWGAVLRQLKRLQSATRKTQLWLLADAAQYSCRQLTELAHLGKTASVSALCLRSATLLTPTDVMQIQSALGSIPRLFADGIQSADELLSLLLLGFDGGISPQAPTLANRLRSGQVEAESGQV